MFRFTIRDVLWLLVDHQKQTLDRSAILWQYTLLLHETGHVSADWESAKRKLQ